MDMLLIIIILPAFLIFIGANVVGISQLAGFVQAGRYSSKARASNQVISQFLHQITAAQGQLYQRARQMEGLSRKLALSNKELARLNAMKSKFLSMAVHDMRSPLSAIDGFSDLLSERSNPKEAQYLQFIRSASDRMTRMMGDLTDLAMIEGGKLKMQFAPFDFAKMVNEMLPGFVLSASKKGVSLDLTEMPAELMMVGDRFRLSQVLQNLLNNATKFTPAGGKVFLRVRRDGNQILAQVRDTGPGIHPSDRKAIFEKFYQSKYQKDQKLTKQGWGLGLSISGEIVSAHGGKIGVESPGLGKGSTFYYRVPLEQKEAARRARPKPSRGAFA